MILIANLNQLKILKNHNNILLKSNPKKLFQSRLKNNNNNVNKNNHN